MVALRNDVDLLTGRAVKLAQDAIVILSNPDASADDIEKADRMRVEATGMKERAKNLLELHTMAGELQNDTNLRGEPQPESGFKSWKEFTGALAQEVLTKGKVRDARLTVFQDTDMSNRKDMSGATGGSGGYLIDPEHLSTLMSVAAPMSAIRPGATVIEMGSRQVDMPIVDQATVPAAGVPTFFGGVRVYWQQEGSSITTSDGGFKQTQLTANELVGLTYVTNSLLMDAKSSLAAFLGSKLGFPGAIAWAEDYAFIRGDGVGKPLGIVNAPCRKTVTRTTTVTVKYDDLVNMEAAFFGNDGVWIISRSLKSILMLINGPSGNAAYLWGDMTKGIPNTLLGRPVIWTDKQPAVGTEGDIILADRSMYVIGDRQSTSVESDPSVAFGSNKTAFRVIHRVDGQPWLPGVITLAGDASTVSPFVTLSTL
jgi:HK97 family phage major capsid protein